jgi:excisionase family DNA binding protein
VSTRTRKLSKAEIQQAFNDADGGRSRPILTPAQLADLVQVSAKTLYEWIAKGRLGGAFRKRGKHVLIWRDRALDLLFKRRGPEAVATRRGSAQARVINEGAGTCCQ